MVHCANSFPHQISFARVVLVFGMFALATLDASAQTRPADGQFQNVSIKTVPPCEAPASGEITALVKNGVELSVNEDWDCDGIADAYDNCVGMPNPEQTDSDGNRIGDVCEAATTVAIGKPVKSRPIPKVERPNAKARGRNAAVKTRSEKAKSRKSEAKGRNPKVERRNARVVDRPSRSSAKKRRRL